MKLGDILYKVVDEKQGNNIARIDYKGTHALFDEMIICDAPNSRLMHAIVSAVEEACVENGIYEYKVEGKDSSDWVLFYADHVVVSVFLKEAREFYNIERLWQDYLV